MTQTMILPRRRDLDADREVQITRTWVGREFMYDTLADVNWSMLRQNLEAAERVLSNPEQYPNADFDALETKVTELDIFLSTHGELFA